MHLPTERKALAALAAAGAVAAAIAGCGGGSSDQASPRKATAAAAAARPSTVVIPQLVGLEQTTAHRVAERAGLELRVTGYVGKYGNGRYNVPCVKVLRQSPVSGERRPKGALIAVIEKECTTPKTGPVPPAGTS